MIFARNLVSVAASYGDAATFTAFQSGEPVEKLTVRVLDADIILQVTEREPVTFTDPERTEMYLERGYHSIVPVEPFTGFRFKAATATPARVHIRAYGTGRPA